jgi:orotate phosphoribosyltransferase
VPHSAVQYVRGTLGMQVCTIAQLSDLLDFLACQSQPELQAHLGHVQAYRDRYGV